MEKNLRNKTYQRRRERFLKTKTKRLDQLQKSLNGLKKLSVKSNHAYEEKDIEEITSFLTNEVYEVIHKFSTTADKRLKYYIQAERSTIDFFKRTTVNFFNLIKNQVLLISEKSYLKIMLRRVQKVDSVQEEIKQIMDELNQFKELLKNQKIQ